MLYVRDGKKSLFLSDIELRSHVPLELTCVLQLSSNSHS